MTTATSSILGRPVWYELMTTDMKAAEPFYNKVVGWTLGAVSQVAEAVHDVQAERRACRWPA